MKFIEYTRKRMSRTEYRTDRLSVNNQGIIIGRDAYKRLGRPKRVKIFYARHGSGYFIRLVPHIRGFNVAHYQMNKNQMTVDLDMPKGKYVHFKDNTYKLEK